MQKRLFILLLFLAPVILQAQNYPVQITTQLIPPFSGYVPDYAVPGEEKLKLLVLFTDFTEPSYNYKLKIKIQGQGITIQSKSYYFAGPFNIQPGQPVQLSGSDLSGLLNTNNLDFSGISLQDYNHRKVLPEGFYSICVTAYDFNNPIPTQVSNEACAFAWFTLSDPPLLNFPQCGSTLQNIIPQQITFQWTPMNLSSPNSMLNTEYEFSLYEIFPANGDPNNIVQTLPPIYQTTTNFSTLNYGLTEPPLVLGRKYVWRVQAKDVTGRDLFRNNGYSQVCTFTYGNIYGDLLNLTLHAQPLTQRVARLWWDSVATFQTYHLEYRKTGGNWNWFPVNTTHASTKVTDLEPNTDYEAHVQGTTSENYTGQWSNTVTFHTPEQPTINCGDVPVPVNMQNIKPLTFASPGNIWQVGQFELLVSQLQNQSSPNGIYSGLGKIVLPFGGMNVHCSFQNILVDEDHNVKAGEIVALTDGVSEWLTQWQSPFHYDESFTSPCDIDSIYINHDGQVIIVCQDGSHITVPNDTDGGLLITDSNGDQWVIGDDGNIHDVDGGGLLPVTHDTLTVQERNILKAALVKIKTEYDDNKIDALQSNLNTSETAYTNFISSESQSISGTSISLDIQTEYLGSFESDSVPVTGSTQKGLDFKSAEESYNVGKVLQIISGNITSNDQLNFIGSYLTVKGKLYKVFVTEELGKGRTEDDIAKDVAQYGLKHLAEMVVNAKMK